MNYFAASVTSKLFTFSSPSRLITRWSLCSWIECSVPCLYSEDRIIDFTCWKEINNTFV
jgi:hypothetical protein